MSRDASRIRQENVKVTTYIPTDLAKKMQELAQKFDRNLSQQYTVAVRYFLTTCEDFVRSVNNQGAST